MQDEHRSQYRLPHELADKLRQAAAASGRSLNAELVARLDASFADQETFLLRVVEEGCRRALQAQAKSPA